ncbi:hypothetical protein [Paenibacillus senegalensis]|uniref:hypothetical protein n=1 Tax=Paenibacillus senegalensis TaxID=1465766 RepID=UPI0003167E93|nr:hypothetical protein [Paenibacillus senegalensis]
MTEADPEPTLASLPILTETCREPMLANSLLNGQFEKRGIAAAIDFCRHNRYS